MEEKFIPALFDSSSVEDLRELLSLNPRDGGLGINILRNDAEEQWEASTKITEPHVISIMNQENCVRTENGQGIKLGEIKSAVKMAAIEKKKKRVQQVKDSIPENAKRCMERAQDKGASAWLSPLPIENQKLVLNKEEFRDALRLRYDLRLPNLPSVCPCGKN